MIWHRSFEQRLLAWNSLRTTCQNQDLESALDDINRWWMNTPWTAYYLHWDDLRDWPDPWQLLNENIFCDVARGLGILYTITMLQRTDVVDARLVETKNYNLVLVHEEKYILNWYPDKIVNNNFKEQTVRRCITQQELQQKLQ